MGVLPLTVLTLNTGKVDIVPRDRLGDFTLQLLMPIVDAEGGPIPTVPGVHVAFMFPRIIDTGGRADGAGYFQVSMEPGMSKHPMVMSMVCWRGNEQAGAWKQIMDGYRAIKRSLEAVGGWRVPPFSPPPRPWLVTTVTPFISIAPEPVAKMMGEFQGCMAWTMIESGMTDDAA